MKTKYIALRNTKEIGISHTETLENKRQAETEWKRTNSKKPEIF